MNVKRKIIMSFWASLFPRPTPPAAVQPQVSANPLLTFDEFGGAGCCFMDEQHVLCGYQPHKRNNGITGIGGSREPNESVLDTAFRETIEELFNLKEVPKQLIELCKEKLQPQRLATSPEPNPKRYIHVILSFEQLETLLALCKRAGVQSDVYPNQLPLTLIDLIRKRKVGPRAEVESLCLMPLIRKRCSGNSVVRYDFMEDMRSVL